MTPSNSLKIVMCIFLVVDSIVVGLRMFVRLKIKKSFGIDDMLIFVAFIGYIVLCGLTFTAIHYHYAEENEVDPFAIEIFTAVVLTYVAATGIAKMSVAVVLYRLAETKRLIRNILLASMVVVILATLITLLLLALQCRPLSKAWTGGPGVCMDGSLVVNVGLAFSIIDIVISWMYALTPVALLWDVQLSLRVKISVILILGCGVLSSIATLLRLKYVLQLSVLNDDGAKIAYLTSMIWTNLEFALTIFAAALTALRPLLQMITGGGSSSALSKGKSSHAFELRDNDPTAPRSVQRDMENQTHAGGDNDSQEFILSKGEIHKQMDVEVQYSWAQKGDANMNSGAVQFA